jgi:hypothetical protein
MDKKVDKKIFFNYKHIQKFYRYIDAIILYIICNIILLH